VTVSIIIPALNEAESLSTLLPELQAMPGSAQLIVADGGSLDQTRSVAATSGVMLVESARGRALQMNAGAAQAGGDILLFLHADTLLPDNAIELVEQAVCAGAHWGRFDLRLSGKHWLLRIVERMINWRSCLSGIATGDQAIFLRRDLFQQLGGYAEIPLMEDVELSKRLKRLARPICIRQPLTTSSRRWERYGIVRTILLMWRLRLAYALGTTPELLAQRYRRSDSPQRGA
jgi:rSAM/selenodomain-associated transferase 2